MKSRPKNEIGLILIKAALANFKNTFFRVVCSTQSSIVDFRTVIRFIGFRLFPRLTYTIREVGLESFNSNVFLKYLLDDLRYEGKFALKA